MNLIQDIKIHSFHIFTHLANVLGTTFDTRKNVKAWFRSDKHPSVKFYRGATGEYFYHDFAGESLDCIAMWATAYNVTNSEACKQIAAFLQLQTTPPPPVTHHNPEPTKPKQYLDVSELVSSCNPKHYLNNNLVKWLGTIVGNDVATDVALRYYVGTSHKTIYGAGATVFWCVDGSGVRYAKVVQYDPATGKRNRDFEKPFLQPKHHNGKGLSPCFFGEHLIQDAPAEQIICIVESEKTALLCSIVLPSFLWISSSGANGITIEKMQSLKSRTVYLVVDSDTDGRKGYQRANEKLTKAGVQTKIVDLFPNRNDKTDLCDFIVSELQKHTTPRTTSPARTIRHTTTAATTTKGIKRKSSI
jgi:5S rRNA maturation endonuclease (ribonuclease M5)